MIGSIIRRVEGVIHSRYLVLSGCLRGNVIKNPFEVVDVPVGMIEYEKGGKGIPFLERKYSRLLFSKVRVAGIILGGDWDVAEDIRSIEADYYAFVGMKQRFLEGRDWESTVYYQRFEKATRRTGVKRGCATWEVYKRRHLARWDRLYAEIRENGYKRQVELNGKPASEVQVGVSRDGRIFFFDGIHRLGMAKILGIEKIPVIVNIWHKEYLDGLRKVLDRKSFTPRTAILPIVESGLLNRNLSDIMGPEE